MLARNRRLHSASLICFALTFVLALTRAAFAAEVLSGGDYHATVTVDGRRLSADTDHVVSFTRSKTLYVCVEDLKEMVMGKRTRIGKQITVVSFKGQVNSGTYVFTIGSTKATVNGKPTTLKAPVVESYGRVYIPLSFFGSSAVPTHVTISPDGRKGNIMLPPD
jgi:hypothetical protein